MKQFARTSALLLCLALTSCITLPSNIEVFHQDGVTVSLRGEKRGSEFVSRGYDHPRVISALRIARVLATIEVDIGGEDDELERTGIMPYDLFEPVSEGMAKAFEEANPGQVVVVMAVQKRRRLGLFHRKYLTSFLAYLQNDEINIHLSRVNWEVPKDKEDKLREPQFNDQVMPFQVARVQGLKRLGNQSVAARWQDAEFGRTAAARRPSGEDGIKRRTILMEDRLPPTELDGELTPEQAEGLTPAQVEALGRLQERRERGEITEDEYLRARDDLLLERF